jgi:hypothetical protein
MTIATTALSPPRFTGRLSTFFYLRPRLLLALFLLPPLLWLGIVYLGANTRFDIRLSGGGHLAVMQQNRDAQYAPEQGSKVTLWWDRRHLMTFGG